MNDGDWRRLDPRMLLVHPVTEAAKLLPLPVASFLIGSERGDPRWGLWALSLVVGFGLSRWYATSYRIGPERVELRTGLLRRRLLVVPRNRIRSVDIEANPLHRLLGLAVLRVGTGHQAGRGGEFRLNALDAGSAPRVRATLLAPAPAPTGLPETAPDSPIPPTGVEIAHWRPAWGRYAPFSPIGLIWLAPVVGLLAQYGGWERLADSAVLRRAGQLSVPALVGNGLLVLAVSWIVTAGVRYLVTWHGLRVIDDGTTLHTTRGLLTTRETTLELSRLRGATVLLPVPLRWAGGAELEAIMTGVIRRHRLLPEAPRTEVERVITYLLGPAAPSRVELHRHGRAARRRRYLRTLVPAGGAAGAAIAADLLGRSVPWPIWVSSATLAVFAAALAEDRYRGLGHAVLPGWLVTQRGSLTRHRDCVQTAGIIGWTVRQSFFQRRAGIATVIAATAAGRMRYAVVDLPADEAWTMVHALTPGIDDHWRGRVRCDAG